MRGSDGSAVAAVGTAWAAGAPSPREQAARAIPATSTIGRTTASWGQELGVRVGVVPGGFRRERLEREVGGSRRRLAQLLPEPAALHNGVERRDHDEGMD